MLPLTTAVKQNLCSLSAPERLNVRFIFHVSMLITHFKGFEIDLVRFVKNPFISQTK